MYAFEYAGYVGVVPAPLFPFRIVGVMQFTGNGSWKAKSRFVSPLRNELLEQEGPYTLNEDCSGTMTVTGASTMTDRIHVLGNGDEILATLIDPVAINGAPAMYSGHYRRIYTGPKEWAGCGNHLVRGRYAQQCTMWGFGMAPGMTLPGAFTATVTGGGGTAEGSGVMVVGGLAVPMTYRDLKYTVNDDCTWDATFDLERPDEVRIPFVEFGVVLDRGKEMWTVTVPPGTPPEGQFQVDFCVLRKMSER
jgi:hypothetical protein